ncbi:MAG: TauD/TfdA family dioxygenase [Actinomycetota bacterium]|nr:TauD/TfdA family dioxygenase [Actinomycetota bacterium]
MHVAKRLATEYDLTSDERDETTALAEQMTRHLVAEPATLHGLTTNTPTGLAAAIRTFATTSNTEGYLLLRSFDIGTLPPTPNTHMDMSLEAHVTTGLLALVAENLGSLLGYADEKHGALIHDVLPVRGEETRIENSGSVSFDFHTENVHHPLRPDYLALLCLRQDHDGVGATRVASVRNARRMLDDAQMEVLRRPEFRGLYPTSFTRGQQSERPRSQPHPVVFGPADAPFMRFNSHNTEAATPEGARALRLLTEALEHVCHEVVLLPGEMVIVDNHVAAHGRSAFTPRYDGHDRWLRRCYATNSLPHWVGTMMPAPKVLPALTELHGIF